MEMSISMKKSSVRTNIEHNNREMNDKEKAKNEHIDYTKSHENKYIVKKDIRELYHEEFSGPLERYNAKQKRKDRKIDDYYKHIKAGKKTAVQHEMIVQIGDKDDFEDDEYKEQVNEILEKWVEGFQERNPKLKVYNAVIHNDEASPHLHLNFVPTAEGYKNGLEKQVSFDKALLNQNPALDKKRPFAEWRENEVAEIEKLMNEVSIKRKLVGTNEYDDVNEYKEMKDKKREFEQLEKEVAEYEEPLQVIKNVEENKKTHKNLFGKNTGKVELHEEDYNALLAVSIKGAKNTVEKEKIDDYDALAKEQKLTAQLLKVSRERTNQEKILRIEERRKHEEEMKEQAEQYQKQYEQQLAAEKQRSAIIENDKNKALQDVSTLQDDNSKLIDKNKRLESENSVLKQHIQKLQNNVRAWGNYFKEKRLEAVSIISGVTHSIKELKNNTQYGNLNDVQKEVLTGVTDYALEKTTKFITQKRDGVEKIPEMEGNMIKNVTKYDLIPNDVKAYMPTILKIEDDKEKQMQAKIEKQFDEARAKDAVQANNTQVKPQTKQVIRKSRVRDDGPSL